LRRSPAGVGVEHREVELGLVGLQVDEEIVDLVQHLGRPGVGPVDLVDDDDRREPGLQGLLQDEARLGERPLGGVHQEQHAVHQGERPLDLAAEVGVARRVDDVQLDPAIRDGGVLGHDRDPLLALEIDGVEHALGDRLVGPEDAALPQHRVDQSRLAVVDVGDDRQVPDVGAGSGGHSDSVYQMRRGDRAGRMVEWPHHEGGHMRVAHWLGLLAFAMALPVPPAAAQGKPMHPTAVITMEKGGEIRIELYPEDAPKTVESFITLSKKGFYDGLTFHRIVPGFVAQGGDPKGDGTGGPGYTLKAEFNKRKHVRGTVAMARSQSPDSAGSQFYICFAPAPHLDNNYTVFGQVTSGMEVVDGIKQGDKMRSVKIEEPKPCTLPAVARLPHAP